MGSDKNVFENRRQSPLLLLLIFLLSIIITVCLIHLLPNTAPEVILASATYPVSLLTADKCVTTSLTRLLAPLIGRLMPPQRDYFFPLVRSTADRDGWRLYTLNKVGRFFFV